MITIIIIKIITTTASADQAVNNNIYNEIIYILYYIIILYYLYIIIYIRIIIKLKMKI